MADPLVVFISWSGARSRAVAEAIHQWLSDLFDNVEPWMSDREIASGSRGLDEIHHALARTACCIVVVTAQNQNSAWINYEAGAASRALGSSAKVIPYLVGFASPAEIDGPLSQFQARLATMEGTSALVDTLADLAHVSRSIARRRFERFWPTLGSAVQAAVQLAVDQPVRRSERELLLEVVEHLRALGRPSLQVPAGLGERLETVAEMLETRPSRLDHEDGEHVSPYIRLAHELRELAVQMDGIT